MTFVLFSYDPKRSLSANLRCAAIQYHKKTQRAATTFFVNPCRVRRDVHFGTVQIVRKPTIMANTVGVTTSEVSA